MIRKSTININNANTGKLNILDDILHEYNRVVNMFISHLWDNGILKGSFVQQTSFVQTWLSARMKQAAAKQALAIVKSQHKKKKKTGPVFCQLVMELDSRFIDICQDVNSFDIWIRLSSVGNKIKILLPGRKHKHLNKYLPEWEMKKSVRIRKNDKGFFIDVFFEKAEPTKKITGGFLAVDIGYKKLLVDNNGIKYGADFPALAKKISGKKQGSKNFLRALKERDIFISRVCNALPLKDIATLVVEDLKNVKYKSKGRLSKKFNNKLQRWTYPKILEKLERLCAEAGVRFLRINPTYTSQICHKCGTKDKKARNGEVYRCKNPLCANYLKKIDADYNAAENILHKGLTLAGVPKIYKTRTVLYKNSKHSKRAGVPKKPTAHFQLPLFSCELQSAGFHKLFI